MDSFRKKLYTTVTENLKVRNFVLILIFANVISIVLESFKPIRNNYHYGLMIFEYFSVSVFSLEYLSRLITADYKYTSGSKTGKVIRYIFSFGSIVDLLSIIPSFLSFDLRVLRLLRVSRLLKLGRYSKSLEMIVEVFHEKRTELLTTLFLSFLLLIIASCLMYYAENGIQPEAFPNIMEAFWWAVCTLTTVGYGDVYPITPLGKLIAGSIAILGIGIVALPTGILSSAFIEKLNGPNKTCPECREEVQSNE